MRQGGLAVARQLHYGPLGTSIQPPTTPTGRPGGLAKDVDIPPGSVPSRTKGADPTLMAASNR